MKKILFLLLLTTSVVSAQVYPPDASSGTATSISPSAFPLLAPDGSGAAPSYSFTSDTDMGCYYGGMAGYFMCQGANTGIARGQLILSPDTTLLGFYSAGGADTAAQFDSGGDIYLKSAGGSILTLNASSSTFTVPILLPNGTQAAKSIQGSAADVGIMFLATPAVSAEAADRSNDEATGYWSISPTLGHFGFSDTAVEVTGLQANVSGWSLVVDDTVDLSSNGSAVSSTVPILAPNGSTTAPAYSFSGETNKGLFSTGADYVSLQTGPITSSSAYVTLDGTDGTGTPVFTVGAQDGGTDITTISCNAWSKVCSISTSNGTDSGSYSQGVNTVTIDADVDNDDDGTITLTTANDTNQMVMSNAGIYFEVEDQTPLNLPAQSGEINAHQEGTSTLTDATATNILSFPLAASATEFVAGSIHLVTKCTDNTNTIFRHDTVDFICKNISDTETCAFQTNLGSALDLVEGTATFSTHTIASDSSATNTVEFTLDADCTLTPTVLETRWEIEFHQPFWAAVTELN